MQTLNLMNREHRILSMNFRATELNSRGDLGEERVQEIHHMSRDDLIQIISQGDVPFLENENLMNQETELLRRLTFLVINYSNDLA